MENNQCRVVFDAQKQPLFIVSDVMQHLGYSRDHSVEDALAHVPAEWRSKAFAQTDNGRELMDVLNMSGLSYFMGPALVE